MVKGALPCFSMRTEQNFYVQLFQATSKRGVTYERLETGRNLPMRCSNRPALARGWRAAEQSAPNARMAGCLDASAGRHSVVPEREIEGGVGRGAGAPCRSGGHTESGRGAWSPTRSEPKTRRESRRWRARSSAWPARSNRGPAPSAEQIDIAALIPDYAGRGRDSGI